MSNDQVKSPDPVCLIHGLKYSEHHCLYCCLCYRPLTEEECNVNDDGEKEDVCKECAKQEKRRLEWVYNKKGRGASGV